MASTHRPFQLRDMKDRVDSSMCWQLQFVGHSTNAGEDAVGPKETISQLLMSSRSQGRLHIWLDLQENEVTNSKCTLRTALISLLFHMGFGAIEMMLQQLVHPATIGCPTLNFRHIRRDRGQIQQSGSIPIECFERRVPDGGVGARVVPKFRRVRSTGDKFLSTG